MPNRWLPLSAIACSVVLWSTAYLLAGWVLETGSPAMLSVLRYALALLVLVPLSWRRPNFVRTLREPRTIVLGLTGVALYYSLANVGLLFTTAGTAALAAACLPALTAIAAVLLIRERLSTPTWIGLTLATVGVALVAAAGLRVDVGVLLNVAALAGYAVYTVLLRRDSGRPEAPDALVLATATGLWGVILLLPWLGWEVLTGGFAMPTDGRGVGSLLFLGLVVTAPTLVLFNYGAERVPAAVSGVATAGIPALGYGFTLLFGEPLDLVKGVGGAIALAGVLVATLMQTERDTGPLPAMPASTTDGREPALSSAT